MSGELSFGDIDMDSQSIANTTRTSNMSHISHMSQVSRNSDKENSSWFKSLKRNLSSKRRGKIAKSGGNISSDTSPETSSSRLIKSEWDICGDDEGDNTLERELNNLVIDKNSFVPGLDLAHGQCGGGSKTSAKMFMTLDSRKMAAMCGRVSIDKKLLHGIKQFNLDPDKGLEILEERGYIKMEPEPLAEFLMNQERLSKKQIGSFLGSRVEFNQKVLECFVTRHQFSNLLLVQALRQFLWSFRLPGEAQQIDRIMSAFATHYCQQNPGTFSNSDTVYILSFAIIMLNTALHNKNVKVKITEEQFVAQNKGIDAGKDLARDMLLAIYSSIKEEPFKIPDETYDDLMFTFFSPEKEGWLVKQGGSWKNWKRRWFVLNDGCLYYFQHTAENVPKGIIPLDKVDVRAMTGDSERPWQLEIFNIDESKDMVKGCKLDKTGTVVVGNHKVYRMCASSKEEREDWIYCLAQEIQNQKIRKQIDEKKERHLGTCTKL